MNNSVPLGAFCSHSLTCCSGCVSQSSCCSSRLCWLLQGKIKCYISPLWYVTCKRAIFFLPFLILLLSLSFFRAFTEAELKAEGIFFNTKRQCYAILKGSQPSMPLCMHHAQIVGNFSHNCLFRRKIIQNRGAFINTFIWNLSVASEFSICIYIGSPAAVSALRYYI